jgi:hypothetical protein
VPNALVASQLQKALARSRPVSTGACAG